MNDYKGKTIFVGIDVHKKTYAVTAISEGRLIKRDVLSANPAILIAYLQKKYSSGNIITAYEAGFCGFHLHRALEKAGIKNIVVHAASLEVSNSRVKTDARDSLKIAQQLAEGRLRCVYIPSPEQEDRRTVSRLRDTFASEKVRIGNQIKSLLYLHGLIADNDSKKVCEKWIEKISALSLMPGLKFSIELLCRAWLEYNSKIKEIEEELDKQVEVDQEIDQIYQSAPGIGKTSARILSNELGDLSQFKNERQLFSYIGLTPSEHSSGDRIRQGHITKQGKPLIRKILVQSAWTAIRYDKGLKQVFDRIRNRAGGKKAIIGIARRLIGRLRACLKVKIEYKFTHYEKIAA
ncbi:MAG: IS110 family transposase [Parachlamydiaceae bacterium]